MSDTENLILCVESRPCLWDTSIEDYHDREKKDIAWLEICNILIPNWETLSENEKKIKIQDLKRKWSNCRDYYRQDKQKLKSPTGSTAKKRKRYVYADILSFLDKITRKRIHEGNYEDDNESVDKENMDIEEQKDNIINQQSEPKKKKKTDVPGEILNILKLRTKPNTIKDYDDDEKYLLSFYGDMKQMTHQQKIDFKLEMMRVLKNVFNASSPSYINSSTPSPRSSYTPIYQDSSRSNSAQSRYITPQTIITIPRPRSQPHGTFGSPGLQNPSVLHDTDPTPRVVINSVENISNDGQSSSAHGDYYEFILPDNMTASTSQQEITSHHDDSLNNYLSFK